MGRLATFYDFLYNRRTNEFCGRTCRGWGEIGLFFFIFYSILAAIFTVHLAIFLAVTPQPTAGRPPWIYGKYAYMNYPNSKLESIMTPRRINFNIRGGRGEVSDFDFNYMERLRSEATASGVKGHCVDRSTRFGLDTRHPCIYLHIAKAFYWTPELINPTLSGHTELFFKCVFNPTPDSSGLPALNNVSHSMRISMQPNGLLLNLSNNANSRSYPFLNQENFKLPILAVSVNLSSLPNVKPERLNMDVSCSLNFNALSMVKPSQDILDRLHEVPSDAKTTFTFY